jgi:hypothetical protein
MGSTASAPPRNDWEPGTQTRAACLGLPKLS